MLASAELRWFWPESPPDGLESWFRAGPCAPGGGQPRRDEYLLDPSQTELGIKARGGGRGVEVKGLVAVGPPLAAPFAGDTQLWVKWTSPALSLVGLPRIAIVKTRWLRKFDTGSANIRELALGADEQLLDRSARLPDRGCHLELVAIEAGGASPRWWTLAFEAFGPFDSVQGSLQRTVAHIANPPPPLGSALQLSYPEWLSRTARRP